VIALNRGARFGMRDRLCFNARVNPSTNAERPLSRNRDYLLLWSGQVVSTLGSTASAVVYPLLILALTDSPKAAGIAGALRALPYIVFSLPVGALIDRWDRRRVMILCDVGRCTAVLAIPAAIALHGLSLWVIYLVTLIEGSLYVFFNIAEVAALPKVVPTPQLPQAAAQNEAGFGAANIVGPSFGAFLFQFGRGVPFLADAVTYAISVVTLLGVRARFDRERALPRRDLHHEVAEGLRWLWGNRLIRYMAFVTGASNLVLAGVPLLMIVVAKRLGAGDPQIGMIFSLAGIGGIVGSLVGGRIQRRFSFGQVIIANFVAECLIFPFYVIVPSFYLLAAVAACNAFLGPIYNVVQFSYRLSIIPDELQGRVNSVFRLLAFGFIPLGAALSGVLIERLGPVQTVLAFEAILVLVAAATAANRHVRDAAPIGRATAS
jgi:predicted MFS family arabinose efflux permease